MVNSFFCGVQANFMAGEIYRGARGHGFLHSGLFASNFYRLVGAAGVYPPPPTAV